VLDVPLTLLGDAWESAEIGAVVFNDARRYLAANPAYCALTGYSGEEITGLRAGHNLLLEELSQAEFIERITDRERLGQAVIRRKDGTTLPVSYMVIPSEASQLPCYIGLVWPQERSGSRGYRESVGYSGVMLVAKERPNLLPLVDAALGLGRHGDQVSGSDVFAAAPSLTSNLLPLSRRGVVEKVGGSPNDGALYRLVDPPGVECALRELGWLEAEYGEPLLPIRAAI
jgi:PAS domain S-box-containing protein